VSVSNQEIEPLDLECLELYAKEILDRVSLNVIKYRKEKNISQLELAKAIGYKSAAYIGKAEIRKDNQHFNIKQIAKISKVLNKDIALFFQ